MKLFSYTPHIYWEYNESLFMYKEQENILLFGLRVPWSGDNSFKFEFVIISHSETNYINTVTALSTLP
jgi:hypothetical protein